MEEDLNKLEEFVHDYEHVLEELDNLKKYVTDEEMKKTIDYIKDCFVIEEGYRHDKANEKIEQLEEDIEELPSRSEMLDDYISEKTRELQIYN